MRYMILLKYGEGGEEAAAPNTEYMAEMGRFNEQLVEAGVMIAGEGLHPTSEGARVRFNGSEINVVDGPFAETKELLAGFWIWEVASKQEATDWVRRIPMPSADTKTEIELRRIFEVEEFGDELDDETRQREVAMREQIAKRQAG